MSQLPEDVTIGGQPRREGEDARPDRIGRFPVIRRIGRGGMGVVWLGFDEQLRRQVAIKVLPQRVAGDARWIERFEQEAAAISALEHPYIVPVHELGTDGGRRFIVMRYVDGDPLDAFVRRLRAGRGSTPEVAPGAHAAQPTLGNEAVATVPSARDDAGASGASAALPASASHPTLAPRDMNAVRAVTERVAIEGNDVAVVLSIVEKCSEAIDFAHRRGVLHRDVKPSNVMIDREGNPQILDFGLAKMTDALDVSRSSVDGREADVIGTLPYVAPEVFAGERRVDHRADIYALGVTLYECLCGARPFAGTTIEELMLQVIGRPPRPPCELREGISRDLQTVMLKALEKNPDHRYSSAGDLARDLRNLRLLQDIEARPVTRAVRLGRWTSRHPGLASIALLALIAVLVVPSVLIANHVREGAERRRMEASTLHVRRAQELDGRRRALLGEIDDRREALVALERAAAPHLPGTDPAKAAVFAARARIADLEGEVADLAGEIDYELQTSHASVDVWTPPSAERVDFYRRLYLEAESDGDRTQMAKYRHLLAAAGVQPEVLAPVGRLTVVTDVPGARARLFPFVRGADGRHLPADESAAIDLGATPIHGREFAAGAWLVELTRDGFKTVRYPVLVERDQHWGASGWHDGLFRNRSWTVRMPREDAFDERLWSYVPAGPYRGGPEEYVGLEPKTAWRWVDAFLIARDELTIADWIAFLEDPEIAELFLGRLRDEDKLTLLPRRTEYGNALVGFDVASGTVRLPESADCSPDVAVGGISLKDLWVHLAWLERQGTHARLPTADEWQKAARGVDGRVFPWGDGFDWSFAASGRAEAEPRPRLHAWPPRSFPDDRSVYGAYDMAGNVAEWCADGLGADDPELGRFWFSGGAFGYGSEYMFACWPWNHAPYDYTSELMGARLARDL